MLPYKLLAFVFLVLYAPSLDAQQYPFTYYTPKDGLIHNNVNSIYQDSRGKLYFLTLGGLSVYDGARFTNYTAKHGVVGNLAKDIIEITPDSLWVITGGLSISCLRNGKLEELDPSYKFDELLSKFLVCRDGTFFLLSEHGLFQYKDNRFIKKRLEGFDRSEVISGVVELNGLLFIWSDPSLGRGMLTVYDKKSEKTIACTDSIAIFHMAVSPKNEIWVSIGNKIKLIDQSVLGQGKIVLKDLSHEFDLFTGQKKVCTQIYFDRANNCWLSTTGGVLRKDVHGISKLFSKNEGLITQTNYILQDLEGNMWFANLYTGVSKLVNNSTSLFSEIEPRIKPDDIFINNKSDSVWMYDNTTGMILLNHQNKVQYFSSANGELSGRRFYFSRGKAMLTGDRIIYSIKLNREARTFHASRIYTDTTRVGNFKISHGLYDKEGNFIVGGASLVIIDKFAKRVVSHRFGDFNDFADNIIVDKNNLIWVFTRTDALIVFAYSVSDTSIWVRKIKQFQPSELPPLNPRSVTIDDSSNVIYLGTRNDGLFCLYFDKMQLKQWKQYTKDHGLSDNFINFLYSENNNLWACTPSGLDKITFEKGEFRSENMSNAFSFTPHIVKIQSDVNHNKWALCDDKSILFVGASEERKTIDSPQVLITSVLVQNQLIDQSMEMPRFNYHENDLNLKVAAPSFINEKQTRYSFMLEGSDNPVWSIPSTSSEFNFIDLPPGKYTFRVKSIFHNNIYPAQTASYSFIILKPWWQADWFKVVVGVITIIVLAAIINVFYKRRLGKQMAVLEKIQAIQMERTRIATDMHDDIGSGLSRIKYLGAAIKRKQTENSSLGNDVDKIAALADEMAERMGEIIWALNEKNDTLGDLIVYMRSYAMEYLNQHNIQCEIEMSKNPPDIFLNGQARRNFFLAVKESLHNIVKHSGATEVKINIRWDQNFTVAITDNGRGIDWKKVKPFNNGLHNIRQRMKEVNGYSNVTCENGTEVLLSIPIT